MTFAPDQIEALQAKLDSKHVRQRAQAGRQLSYIEGWWAIAEANRIFGHDAWHRETIELKLVSEHQRKIGKGQYEKDGWGVTYLARVKVTVGNVVREGCGAGHGIDADLGAAHESASKEAETDAMKRALMTFGNPFGLALYDKEQANVETKADKDPVKEAISNIGSGAPPKKDPLGPWKGPLPRSQLIKKLRELKADVLLCEDFDMLKSCLSGYQGVIEQLKIDAPDWWDGEPDGNGFVPMKQLIDERESFLATKVVDYMRA